MCLFVAFEGGEGSGKSTQAKALYRRLLRSDIPVVLTHEPGGTALGRGVRHWLKWAKEIKISPLSELLLFAASRSQLVAEVIRPNLSRGVVVICDRSAFSTVAYQGYGRELDLQAIQAVNAIATQELLPELVILLDIPAEVGLARKRRAKLDRFEREEVAFHQRVHYGYLQLAAADLERWLVVNAILSKGEIELVVWERVKQLLHHAPITQP